MNLHDVNADTLLSANDPFVALLSLISDTKPVQETLQHYVQQYHEQVKAHIQTIYPLMNYLLQLKLPYHEVTHLLREVTRMLSIKKEDLVFYKDGLEKGLETIRNIILKQLTLKFKLSPDQETTLKQALLKITELEAWDELSLQILRVNSFQEFMNYLNEKTKMLVPKNTHE